MEASYKRFSTKLESVYNAPEALKGSAHWMGTRFERRPDGKTDKPPYRVNGPGAPVKADKRNPENHATFAEAVAALERGDVDAIGFVFSEADEFILIDLDGAIDERGQLTRTAEKIVGAFPTYWEVSQSGRGLHGITRAEKPGPRCAKHDKGVEMYDGRTGARFAVITGDKLDASTDSVTECQDAANVLYSWAFGDSAKQRRAKGQRPRTPRAASVADDALLDLARNARNGAKFRRLFDVGEIPPGKSRSEADYQLINLLIFWCAGDLERVEALFRRSALHRDREAGSKHGGYIRLSIDNAFESYTGKYYEPRAVREEPVPEREDALAPFLRLLLDPSLWTGPKGASAYKAYAALVLLAVENGIKTGAKELRVGCDVRRLAERAGVERATLCRSTLPYLVRDRKLLRWTKGRGGADAGTFVLRAPKVPHGDTNKDTYSACGLFIGVTVSESLAALGQFIRMRSGRSQMAEVARLGPVAMFCMVPLCQPRRGLTVEELAEAVGRRKDNVRRALRKLAAAGLAEEPERDRYRLSSDFWRRFDAELERSGITYAEREQRRRHEADRETRDTRLAAWREERKNVYPLRKRKRGKDGQGENWGTNKKDAAKVVPLAKRDVRESPQAAERRRREQLIDEYERTVERNVGGPLPPPRREPTPEEPTPAPEPEPPEPEPVALTRPVSAREAERLMRRGRSGPALALGTYLGKKTEERFEWLCRAVLAALDEDADAWCEVATPVLAAAAKIEERGRRE